ncbi:MAG TPA: VWA-like domain-containing protein, partial [Thermaerobacter sp.]
GGTDMRVGIEAACKLRPKPGVIVVFTDGETPWPERPPEVPTVIALVGDAKVETPAWAPMVRISLERSA